MRKKSIRGLLCLLILVVLGGCGKAKVESASTEEIVPVEEIEQAETINNTDDTEEENIEAAEELIPETYAFSCKVTINPEIELYLNQKNEIVGFEYLNENAVPQNPCTACGGTGKCQECKGDGYRGSGYSVSCPRCHGALTETCIYCDANGNSMKHEGICDFPNCMGAHVYACTICGGGTKPVTCESCGGSGACNVCGGSGSL